MEGKTFASNGELTLLYGTAQPFPDEKEVSDVIALLENVAGPTDSSRNHLIMPSS